MDYRNLYEEESLKRRHAEKKIHDAEVTRDDAHEHAERYRAILAVLPKAELAMLEEYPAVVEKLKVAQELLSRLRADMRQAILQGRYRVTGNMQKTLKLIAEAEA